LIRDLNQSPMSASKSEFETSEHYEERRSSLFASKRGQYVLLPDDSTVLLSYDADNEDMNCSVKADSIIGLDEELASNLPTTSDADYHWSGISLRSVLRSKSRYVASNSLGVRVNVTSAVFEEYGIVFSKNSTMFEDSDSTSLGDRVAYLTLKMKAQDAKQTKPFLKIAVVCTLMSPRVYETVDGHTPTITDPVELTVKKKYVLVRADELWLYDKRSGYILGKFVADDNAKQ
jgi:hypothetical protein